MAYHLDPEAMLIIPCLGAAAGVAGIHEQVLQDGVLGHGTGDHAWGSIPGLHAGVGHTDRQPLSGRDVNEVRDPKWVRPLGTELSVDLVPRTRFRAGANGAMDLFSMNRPKRAASAATETAFKLVPEAGIEPA